MMLAMWPSYSNGLKVLWNEADEVNQRQDVYNLAAGARERTD